MNQIIIYTIYAEILIMIVYEIRRRLRNRRYNTVIEMSRKDAANRIKYLAEDNVIDNDLTPVPRGTCGTYRMLELLEK